MATSSSSSVPTADECSICLSSLVQPGMDIFTTACQHQFHFTCLAKNVQAQNNECPLCRTQLNSLVQLLHAQTPVAAAASVSVPPLSSKQQAAPSTSSTGAWSTLARSISNAFSWMNGSFRKSRPSTAHNSEEDPVNDAAVRALAARVTAARQAVATGLAELPLITATTTLEFGGQISTEKSNIYGLVTLKAPSLLPTTASEKEMDELRVPIDLVCVIDQSGSMQGAKIALLKDTLNYIVDQMGSLDRLAVVSFDTTAYDRSNGLKMMHEANKQTLRTTIAQNINAGGGTNIGTGLEMGIELFKSRRTKNPLSAMLLLTDGQDNTPKDYSGLMATLPEGVVCHTFGYGPDHQAFLLSQIAEQGHGGTFTYIDQVDAIGPSFATALGGLFTCVAKQLRVKLEFNPNYSVTHSHSTYAHEPNQLPSRHITFKLTDLNADESRNLVFQLNVPALDQPLSPNDSDTIGHVSLDYIDPNSGNTIQTPSVPFTLTRPLELDPQSPLLRVNYALDLQRNRAETSRVLKQAVEESDYARARELLNQQLTKIRSSVSAQDPLCQQLIRDLEYQYTSQYQFKTTMTNMYMQHGQERATYSTATTISACHYMTSGQERFRQKYASKK